MQRDDDVEDVRDRYRFECSVTCDRKARRDDFPDQIESMADGGRCRANVNGLDVVFCGPRPHRQRHRHLDGLVASEGKSTTFFFCLAADSSYVSALR